MDRPICDECGARLPEGQKRCDLCGALQESADEPPTNAAPSDREIKPDFKASRQEDDRPYAGMKRNHGTRLCTDCGWENPSGAKFCSECGARLQVERDRVPRAAEGRSAPVLPPERTSDEQSSTEKTGSLGWHVAALVGLSVMVVVALFMVTVISKQPPAAQPDDAVAAPSDVRTASIIQEHEAIPVAEQYRPRIDSLRAAVEEGNGDQAIEARHRLVEYFVEMGRIDRAAIEQMRLAGISDLTADWKKSGNLLLDWMEMSALETKPEIALLAIDSYKRVLEQEPGDLEARANLGWAYQYDPQNPMQAIQQTNLVLEEDADHLMANYNKGVFLMHINRIDQAVEQFERVKDLAGAESPYYRQADMWIDAIRESQAEREAG